MAEGKKRNYEVSIWTLQDEFISVLKPNNLEYKGFLSDPIATIKDDGTEEFNFSIPMYLYDGTTRKENPIWHTTQDGTIVSDMRKIKLTFNRGDAEAEHTFEFLILEVTERHENDQLYCDVKCEGMAFHELGKIGYKISLSAEAFYGEVDDWYEDSRTEWNGTGTYNEETQKKSCPVATLDYWVNTIMQISYEPSQGSWRDPSQWYYRVEMDWSSYSKIPNSSNPSIFEDRLSTKVYEDPYVPGWNYNGEVLSAKPDVGGREKARLIDSEESNIYNLTQTIAEEFGVFCRYEYTHDSNLQITGRTIIFYNSYMNEKKYGYIDLTYPYSTSSITRTRDSNDLTTKMFVRPVDDETSASGMITILDVEANKSREDYILNFDYLHSIGGITDEQYNEIPKFEAQMRKKNEWLQLFSDSLFTLYNLKPEVEAAKTQYENAISLDEERLGAAQDLKDSITKGEDVVHITDVNPRSAILIKSVTTEGNDSYYINIQDKGVLFETVKIFKTYNFTNAAGVDRLTNAISQGVPDYDEYGILTRITGLKKEPVSQQSEEISEYVTNSARVYLTYDYDPVLPYQRVIDTWTERLNKDRQELSNAEQKLEILEARIREYENLYQEYLKEKNKIIKKFEKMMGPALRESYWAPEDYTDYGDDYIDSFTITDNSQGESGFTCFTWTGAKFDDELEKASYKQGVNQVETNYPVIVLPKNNSDLKEKYKNLSFIFKDSDANEQLSPRNARIFTVGSTAQYGFSANGDPVLIITGFDTLSDTSRNRLWDNQHQCTLGVVTTVKEESGNTYNITTNIDPLDGYDFSFLNKSSQEGKFTSVTLYYPRIEITTLSVKTDSEMLGVKYNNKTLKQFEEFYILPHTNGNSWDDFPDPTEPTITSVYYYLTIKPEVFIREGISNSNKLELKFNISNANTAIYLDALKVLKENSQPKVSYTIDPSVINDKFLYVLYKQLCHICNINDTELKFKDVQGYISELELNCDKPWEDKITIKNYKTKFEDLFSTIVAETQEMKKKTYAIEAFSSVFSGEEKVIDEEVIQNTVMKVDLNYAFNNGKLTISEEDGIWGTSDSGVVAFRGGGIFTATKKDENGNWIWNTGIVPQGINADLISTGQLDTNKILVYAGDKVRFQLNGEGLFAYKSIFEEYNKFVGEDGNWKDNISIPQLPDGIELDKDLDRRQYVLINENGLALWAKSGAYILSKDLSEFKQVGIKQQDDPEDIPDTYDIKRVEISWDGMKLRNWKNKTVFFADADTGNLYLDGDIYARNLYLGGDYGDFDSGEAFVRDSDGVFNQGGRNLLLDTDIPWDISEFNPVDPGPITSASYKLSPFGAKFIPLENNKDKVYTLSYDWKLKWNGSGSPSSVGEVIIQTTFCDHFFLKLPDNPESEPQLDSLSFTNRDFVFNEGIAEGHREFQVKLDQNYQISNLEGQVLNLNFYYIPENYEFIWSNVKFECGEKATSWSNAPEDFDGTRISNTVKTLNTISGHTIDATGIFSKYHLGDKDYSIAMTGTDGLLIAAENGILICNKDDGEGPVEKNDYNKENNLSDGDSGYKDPFENISYIKMGGEGIEMTSGSNSTLKLFPGEIEISNNGSTITLDENGIDLSAGGFLTIDTQNFEISKREILNGNNSTSYDLKNFIIGPHGLDENDQEKESLFAIKYDEKKNNYYMEIGQSLAGNLPESITKVADRIVWTTDYTLSNTNKIQPNFHESGEDSKIYPIGTLGIIYTSLIDQTTTPQEGLSGKVIKNSYYLTTDSYAATGHSKTTYFGVYSTRWNTSRGASDIFTSNQWARIGYLDEDINQSTVYVPIKITHGVTTNSIQLKFKWRYSPAPRGDVKWNCYSSNSELSNFNSQVNLNIYSSNPSQSPIKLGSGSFNLNITGSQSLNTTYNCDEICTMPANIEFNSGTTYYFVFSAPNTNHSLKYIDQDSIIIGGSGTPPENNYIGIAIKKDNNLNGEWVVLHQDPAPNESSNSQE